MGTNTCLCLIILLLHKKKRNLKVSIEAHPPSPLGASARQEAQGAGIKGKN
jgi:hypothetical protein